MPFTTLVLLLAALPGHALRGDAFRNFTYDSALVAARKESKLVVVDFQSATSPESQKLEKVTMMDSRVRAFLAERVIAIHADPEHEAMLARKFHVEATPVVLFVDAQGAEIDRYVGFLEPMTFLTQARGTLEGKDALVRARAKLAAKPNDPRAHLDLARVLHDKGKSDEELDELLWCFDHGVEHDPAFAEQRYATVLPEIHRLAQAHPDALDKLAQRSDEAAERILAGKSRPDDVDVVLRIDERMSRIEHTLELYDALAEKPELADARRQLASAVFVVLLADRRYDEALECLGDPAAALEKSIAECVRAERSAATDDAKSAQATARLRHEAIETGCRAFEVLLGVRDLDEAEALLERVLAFDARVPTFDALMEAALLAEQPSVASEIARRALKTALARADALRFRVAIACLPKPR